MRAICVPSLLLGVPAHHMFRPFPIALHGGTHTHTHTNTAIITMVSSSSTPHHVVIIGGVAAGATAAARLRRLNDKVRLTIVEEGPYISYANCRALSHFGRHC